VSGTFWQATQPVSLAASVAVTAAQLPAALGQATMSGSLPVAIASNQGAVPVSGTFWQATQPVSLAALPALAAGSNAIGSVTNPNLELAQASPTSTQTGPLIQGAVTTSSPSYTTAKTSPLSLTLLGGLRVEGQGSAGSPSGSVLSVQGVSGGTAQPVTISTSTTGGTGKIALSNVNQVVSAIKSSTGTLYGLLVSNMSGAPAYVEIFDATTAGVTLGTTTASMLIMVPSGSNAIILLPAVGVSFSNAISIASVTAAGGSTGSSNGVYVTAFFV
jgi:hypothetical protein